MHNASEECAVLTRAETDRERELKGISAIALAAVVKHAAERDLFHAGEQAQTQR